MHPQQHQWPLLTIHIRHQHLHLHLFSPNHLVICNPQSARRVCTVWCSHLHSAMVNLQKVNIFRYILQRINIEYLMPFYFLLFLSRGQGIWILKVERFRHILIFKTIVVLTDVFYTVEQRVQCSTLFIECYIKQHTLFEDYLGAPSNVYCYWLF